jgi:TRAP-type C4-dicarboxylate transport system permease small subunit
VSGLLTRLFDLVSAALLGGMAAVTFVDVIGRYLFNRPLRGAFELTEVLMAAVIFAALPSLTLRREHIAIDLLDRYYPPRLARLRDRVIELASALIVAALAWEFFQQAQRMHADGLYTQALQMPLAPVVFFACGALAVGAAMHLVTLQRIRR